MRIYGWLAYCSVERIRLLKNAPILAKGRPRLPGIIVTAISRPAHEVLHLPMAQPTLEQLVDGVQGRRGHQQVQAEIAPISDLLALNAYLPTLAWVS